MIEIKAKDLLKSDYQLLGEQHIKLQQENKQLKDVIKELQDMVNDKDLLYKKSLGREVERQKLLDKIYQLLKYYRTKYFEMMAEHYQDGEEKIGDILNYNNLVDIDKILNLFPKKEDDSK